MSRASSSSPPLKDLQPVRPVEQIDKPFRGHTHVITHHPLLTAPGTGHVVPDFGWGVWVRDVDETQPAAKPGEGDHIAVMELFLRLVGSKSLPWRKVGVVRSPEGRDWDRVALIGHVDHPHKRC